MRTTLKRGLGRAGANGNGRPVFPPGAVTPMTRYRQPPPPHRGGWAAVRRILFWGFVSILMVVCAIAGGAYLFFHREVSNVQAHSSEVKIAQKRLDVPMPGEAAIALVIGYDHRANESASMPSRSDTVMLLRADPQVKAISMLSFPRDLTVTDICPGKPPFHDRINAAYAVCGAPGTLATVKALTGLPINYLITVNFHGFKDIVNRVGGVWLDIDRRYYNRNVGTAGTNFANIDLHPGYQKLNGEQALDYVRYRHTDSDIYRTARQQLFVKALKEQVTHSLSPLGLPGLIDTVTKNVEIGAGGGHAISGKTILSYMLFAYGLPSGHFFPTRFENLQPYGIGSGELLASPSDVQSAVQDFTTPDVNAPKEATASALGIRPRQPVAPRPQDTTVLVLNGSGVTGSASSLGFELGKRGYQIVVPPNGQPANAPTFDYFHSKVYFEPGRPAVKAAAQVVANLLSDADVEPLPATIQSYGSMLTVVVGQTFHGSIAPAPIVQTPKHEPPAVVANPKVSLPLVHATQRKMPFPLEVPRVLERTSVPDSEEPARVYWLGKYRALRLSFRTGRGEYWGIEETSWVKAPVLAGANFQHRLAGRTYDLYYSGPHLHMVVLRQHGATYWVVNTLLDSLSNETMLAIAKGLRTFGH